MKDIDPEMHRDVKEVVATAITQMKCMALKAQLMREDIRAIQLDPSPELVEAFCRKYDHGQE